MASSAGSAKVATSRRSTTAAGSAAHAVGTASTAQLVPAAAVRSLRERMAARNLPASASGSSRSSSFETSSEEDSESSEHSEHLLPTSEAHELEKPRQRPRDEKHTTKHERSQPNKPAVENPVVSRKVDPAPAATFLRVEGCEHPSVCQIIHGAYLAHSQNHGKAVYRKTKLYGDLDVLIYFWDSRDGSDMAGWWFAPSVGGDQVWAFNPNQDSATPPHGGWRVPHDGPLDPGLKVTVRHGTPSSSSREGTPEKRVTKSDAACAEAARGDAEVAREVHGAHRPAPANGKHVKDKDDDRGTVDINSTTVQRDAQNPNDTGKTKEMGAARDSREGQKEGKVLRERHDNSAERSEGGDQDKERERSRRARTSSRRRDNNTRRSDFRRGSRTETSQLQRAKSPMRSRSRKRHEPRDQSAIGSTQTKNSERECGFQKEARDGRRTREKDGGTRPAEERGRETSRRMTRGAKSSSGRTALAVQADTSRRKRSSALNGSRSREASRSPKNRRCRGENEPAVSFAALFRRTREERELAERQRRKEEKAKRVEEDKKVTEEEEKHGEQREPEEQEEKRSDTDTVKKEERRPEKQQEERRPEKQQEERRSEKEPEEKQLEERRPEKKEEPSKGHVGAEKAKQRRERRHHREEKKRQRKEKQQRRLREEEQKKKVLEEQEQRKHQREEERKRSVAEIERQLDELQKEEEEHQRIIEEMTQRQEERKRHQEELQRQMHRITSDAEHDSVPGKGGRAAASDGGAPSGDRKDGTESQDDDDEGMSEDSDEDEESEEDCEEDSGHSDGGGAAACRKHKEDGDEQGTTPQRQADQEPLHKERPREGTSRRRAHETVEAKGCVEDEVEEKCRRRRPQEETTKQEEQERTSMNATGTMNESEEDVPDSGRIRASARKEGVDGGPKVHKTSAEEAVEHDVRDTFAGEPQQSEHQPQEQPSPEASQFAPDAEAGEREEEAARDPVHEEVDREEAWKRRKQEEAESKHKKEEEMRRLEEKMEEKRAKRRQQEEAKKKAEEERAAVEAKGKKGDGEEATPDAAKQSLEEPEAVDDGSAQKRSDDIEDPGAPEQSSALPAETTMREDSPRHVSKPMQEEPPPGECGDSEEVMPTVEDDESSRKQQEQAVFAVKRTIRSLANANFENFEHARGQFHQVLQSQLDACGSQAPALKEEAAAVLSQTTSNFNQILEQKRKFEMMQAAQQHLFAKAPPPEPVATDFSDRLQSGLVRELNGLVTEAEVAARGVRDMAKRFNGCLSPPELMGLVPRVEAAAQEVNRKINASRDFLQCRRMEMERGKSSHQLAMLRQELSMMAQRVQEAGQAANNAITAAQMAKGSLRSAPIAPRGMWAGNMLPNMWPRG